MATAFQIGKFSLSFAFVRRCPHCGSGRVKKSRHGTKLSLLLSFFGFNLFRCVDCWERYFGLRGSRLSEEAVENIAGWFMDEGEALRPPLAFKANPPSGPNTFIWLGDSNTAEAARTIPYHINFDQTDFRPAVKAHPHAAASDSKEVRELYKWQS
jgi:hypothetical protein